MMINSITSTNPPTSPQLDGDTNILPSNHFLSLPRPDTFLGPTTPGTPDTTTLAAHDFDVDNRTGFMPPHPPPSQLPAPWDVWETILASAQILRLQLGDTPGGLSEEEKEKSREWRGEVERMESVDTDGLRVEEVWLRRAHHVLAWMMHFYVHTVPPPGEDGGGPEILIPRSLGIPLLRVCAQLQLPPVLTYSDNVLYNWTFHHPSASSTPTPTSPLECQTQFTHTHTESEFYLVSARIELIGVRALSLMRATLDEIFVSDDIAVRRITSFLSQLAGVVRGMKAELVGLRKRGCEPDVFFNLVRPWLRGQGERRWVFEGLDEEREKEKEHGQIWEPVELSGPSAGQSALIHALDIFLGVDKWSHAIVPTVDTHNTAFLTRMQQYMPRHHRHFLHHLSSIPKPLREFVVEWSGRGEEGMRMVEMYNEAVKALKEFRDAHLVVVALFIVGPAARATAQKEEEEEERRVLKGTGGTDVIRYLKSVRDQTKGAAMNS